MKIDHRRKVHKKHSSKNNMIIGTQSDCAAANLAISNLKGGGTDFSIAAIMARGGSSREPSERSISKLKGQNSIHLIPWSAPDKVLRRSWLLNESAQLINDNYSCSFKINILNFNKEKKIFCSQFHKLKKCNSVQIIIKISSEVIIFINGFKTIFNYRPTVNWSLSRSGRWRRCRRWTV